MPDQGRPERRECNLKRQHKPLKGLLLSLVLCFAACNRFKPDSAESFQHARETYIHGYLEKAQAEVEEGYKRSLGKDPEWTWKFLLLKSDILLRRGFYQDVLAILSSSVPPQVADQDLAVKRSLLIGIAQAKLLNFTEAQRNLQGADRLCETNHCGIPFDVQTAHGIVELAQGRPDHAEDFFRTALQTAKQGDGFQQSAALLNLGIAALHLEHFDEAIDWCTRTDTTAQTIGSGLDEAKALGCLAWASYKTGDFANSLRLSLEARKKAHDLGIVNDEIRWLNNAGLVYYETNQLLFAEENYRQSLSLARKTNDREQTFNAFVFLAFASIKDGRLDLAKQYCDQALEIAHGDNNRALELYALLAKGEIAAAGSSDHKQAEQIFKQVVKDANDDVSLRWQSKNDLAKLYEAGNRISESAQQYQAALCEVENARGLLRHEEFRLPFLANASHLYDDYIHFLIKQGKTAQALQAADYSRAQTLAEGLGFLKTKQNCSSLTQNAVNFAEAAHKAGGTILFYWLGQKQSYLWVIQGNRVNLFELASAPIIEILVQNYRKALLDPPNVLLTRNQAGIGLYKALIAPAEKLIPVNSRVTVIADGSLNNLNFETLLAPAPKLHYWIEDVTLTNASSLRMLASSRTMSPDKAAKLLLIGDPIMPDAKFPPLPNAKIEMQNIEKHFTAETSRIFSGSEANPSAFFNSKPESFSYLHFVAHGTASQLSPLDSAVILSKATSEEDSYKLHARDIVSLSHPLHAELVVISTCYGSGTTLYNGEGLVGLSWAFLRAGSHNVIGALWAVSDTSTPMLMDQLYAELGKGRSPQDALRAAKLTLLHSEGAFRKPIYWAPFQLYTGS
jgi:CHAT domain-containing protein